MYVCPQLLYITIPATAIETLIQGEPNVAIDAPRRAVSPVVSIVDDDPWAREGITNLVASLGYRALSFASAREFLESDYASDTRCLILDLQMPGLSGLDLQELLIAQGHNIAVIMMTAYPEDKSRKRALDAGAAEFFVKPLDEAKLALSLMIAFGPAR